MCTGPATLDQWLLENGSYIREREVQILPYGNWERKSFSIRLQNTNG